MSHIGPVRGIGFFVVLAGMPTFNLAHWVLNILVFTLMYTVMSSAWNLVGGFAGYPSLGHAAFFGIGAYSMNLWFENRALSSGYEPFLFLPVIGVFAALIGLGVAAIAMRARADVFAIVTITLLFVAQTLAFNLRGLTHGAQGIAMAVPPFPAATFELPFYYVLLALLALTMLISFGAMRSKFGLSLAAIRADEDKARGIGVRVFGVKVLAFSISVGLTAMVGGVWAYYEGYIYPQFAIDPLLTIAIVLMTFLGGRATLWGPVIGALLLETTQQMLAYTLGGSQFYLIAYALVFLLVMLLMPQGIVPSVQDLLRHRRRRAVVDAGGPDGTPSDTSPPAAPPVATGAAMTAVKGRA